MSKSRTSALLAAAAVLAVAPWISAATPPAAAPKPPPAFATAFPSASPLGKWAGHQADAALDTAADDLPAAVTQVDAAFAVLARYASPRDLDALREVAGARRLLHGMSDSPSDGRAELLAYLRAHPPLAHAVAFAVESDHSAGLFELLDHLRRERPAQAAAYPELTAALCVVRDRPLSRRLNENRVTAADPLAIFDFYVAHEHQLYYGLKGVPVELLAYVVDTTASVKELTWAINKYAGNKDVGKLFFDIKYDTDYFAGRGEKKLDDAGGYTLPNILKFGGVCIDQAYFATTVGQAIGVPTAIATASSAEAGHAWVGFLRSSPNGRSAAWDFNSGRYPEYQGLRGDVADPLTGSSIADSTVGMLGDLIGTSAVARQNAVALTDAAAVLGQMSADDGTAYPAELVAKGKPPAGRAVSADGQLDLIEQSLKQFAAYAPAWELVAGLAKDGKLSLPQKKHLAEQVQQLCGARHPDFAVAVLTPMIETVDDPAEQSRLWDAAFALVKTRADLAAEVRFRQADLWEQHHDLPKAGSAYADVVAHYLNAGPFAVKALAGAASVLKQMNREKQVLDLYADAAKRVAKPSMTGRAEFMHQSNWYKIHQAYAAVLDDAGQGALAAQMRGDDAK